MDSAAAMDLVAAPVCRLSVSKAVVHAQGAQLLRPCARMAVKRATRWAMRLRPSGPWYTAYMLAMTAGSTCAVQMLEWPFAADVLFARLQRQAVGGLAVHVHAHAHQAAGHGCA